MCKSLKQSAPCLLACLLWTACDSGAGVGADAVAPDGGGLDAGVDGARADADPPDASVPDGPADARPVEDAAVEDAAVADAAVEDAAVEDAAVEDAAVEDAAVEDGPIPDVMAADGAGPGVDASDGSPDAEAGCGDGVLDDGEACDQAVFLDDLSCADLALPAGALACRADCTVDTAGCAVCGDDICSDAETSGSCPQDCGVRSIAAGRSHTCVVLADGSLWCWGAREGHGMGGTPDVAHPVRVPGHDDVVQVTAGDHHTCFLNQRNEIWCFGRNGFGEAGPAPEHHVFPPARAFVAARSVEAGRHHTCAIGMRGGVQCWGRGDYGQRGDGEFSMRRGQPRPIVADAQTAGARALSLSGFASCAALSTDFVRCWGANLHGFINNDYVWRSAPNTLLALPGLRLTSVALGSSHVCAMSQRADGSRHQLACFGGNAYGQLGLEPSLDVLAGRAFEGDFAPVATGFSYSCAQQVVGERRTLRCWGDNYFGQLGDGTLDARVEPAPVLGVPEVAALAGGVDHVCAILGDETARCWGRNREGQIGDGTVTREVSTPVAPLGLGAANGGER